jgi:hypothetical protein
MPLRALTSTTASSKDAGFAKAVDASATKGANLTLARQKHKLAAVLIWRMIEWFSQTACCLYGARLKK